MYLKEIKLYGFKSFADKTSIVFSKNINGIVGPNGSGKSNVLDAVRFVLGEQSSKTLRGDGSINDVIFSGSKSRKPLNSASVTLVFDNSLSILPIAFNEVAIKRTVYKSGENEYFINGERCRLKDITDLLLDTSSSKESFNIIGQGKISEIISSKPVERRSVFEEAAGVLKYKKRKEEAIKKLAKTSDNLVRVNDIILELENNIKPLEKQSNDAKRYLTLKEDLSELEISLITFDIEKLNFNYKESIRQIDLLKDEIIDLNTTFANSDILLLQNKNKLKEIDIEINQKQNELVDITSSLEKLNASLKVLKEREKFSQEKDKIKENIDNLKEDKLQLETDINNLKNDILIVSKEMTNDTSKIDDLVKKDNDLKDKITKLIDTISKNKREENDLKYKIEYLENLVNNNSNLPSSVKNILNNAKFNKVHNIIIKLIEMEEKYNLAIVTSLGMAASYIVTDDEEEASRCVSYLKENNLGRATFYPLNLIKPRNILDNVILKIKDMAGFVAIACDLVTYDSKYENIILNQLGNVIIATDINEANKIAKVINHSYKIVTLDGNIINVGGSITGGSNLKNNVLKDKYEIDNCNNKYRLLLEKMKGDEKSLINLQKEQHILDKEIYELRNKINLLNDEIKTKNNNLLKLEEKLTLVNSNLDSFKNVIEDKTSKEEMGLFDSISRVTKEKDDLVANINVLKLDKENINEIISQLEEENKKNNIYLNKKEKQLKDLEILINRIEVKLDSLLEELTLEYNMTFDKAKSEYKLEINALEARNRVNYLKDEINKLGEVNTGAISEFERVSERYNFLTKQKADLVSANDTLLEIINSMDEVMKEKFITTFDKVNEEFTRVFKELFRGGNASLRLTDKDNLLETGVEIIAQPPGKSLKSINALSGGEQTFTAISLLFAILNVKRVPFCIFDEVEAALDEVNVDNFGKYLDMYHDKTQFIIITHKKKTMEYADILYGITMQESGVSRLVSVKLEDIKKES